MTPAPGGVRVWPLWLRLSHWALAASVLANFATHEGGGVWHERWGWLALALACMRMKAGLLSHNNHVRFQSWLKGPSATWCYAKAQWRGLAPRHVGHNPLGGWMMAVLLINTLLCGLSGWLYTTDRCWGLAWLETLHGALGDAFVPLVLLHVAGALWASRQQRENLIAAMLHGDKRAAAPGDMDP